MVATSPQATDDARAAIRRLTAIDIDACPNGEVGRWRAIEVRQADRAAGSDLTCGLTEAVMTP